MFKKTKVTVTAYSDDDEVVAKIIVVLKTIGDVGYDPHSGQGIIFTRMIGKEFNP